MNLWSSRDESESAHGTEAVDLAARLGLIEGADCRSNSTSSRYITVLINNISTDELRAGIKPSWPGASRDQLLAYYKNRKIYSFMYEQPAKKSAD